MSSGSLFGSKILSYFLFVALLLVSVPTQADACGSCHGGHGGGGGFSLSLQIGRGRGFFRRPICPVGQVRRGCRAPARKFLRGVAMGLGRGLSAIGRRLFGRRA